MALDRVPMTDSAGNKLQATEGVRFVARMRILEQNSKRVLDGDTLTASAYAPADGSKPTVTVVAVNAPQTGADVGLCDISIAAAQVTSARIGNDWEIDIEVDDGGGPVIAKHFTLQNGTSNAQ